MITKDKLSFLQLKRGKSKLLTFSFMNGIALTFLTGNVLSLYLLQLDFSPTIIVLLSAIAYSGALFVFTGRAFIANIGAVSTLRVSWTICGIAAIAVSIIPSLHYYKIISKLEMLFLIVIFLLILYVFKTIGTVAISPLMGEYTDNSNRGKFTSSFFILYNISTIIAILSLLFIYSNYKTLFVFQLLILLSGIIKISTNLIFRKTHETHVPIHSAKIAKTNVSLSHIWKTPEYRSFLIFKSLARGTLILIIPISILALKITYNLQYQTALIFACIQLLGGFLVSYLHGVVSDYTGAKPLVIINIMILFVICILWMYSPDVFIWEYCAVIFFLGGIGLFGLDSSLNHYSLTIISAEDTVGVSLWLTTIGGIVSGISGIILGGGLIKLYSSIAIHEHIFKYYYSSILVLLMPTLYFACRLKASTTKELNLKKVFNLLFTPAKLYSLHSLQAQEKYSSPENELENVNKLEGMSDDIAEDRLIYFFESPDYFVSTKALFLLWSKQLKEKSKITLYKMVKFRHCSNPLDPSLVLAKNNFTKAIPLYRSYLSDDDNPYVWSSIMVLAIIKDESSFSKIISIFQETTSPMVIIYGAKAIAIIDDKKNLPCLFNKLSYCYSIGSPDLVDKIVVAISMIISCNDNYYKFIRQFEHDSKKGLRLLEDLFDNELATELSRKSEQIILDYYNNEHDFNRKINAINFLKETLSRNTSEMRELKIFKDYFFKTDPKHVSRNLIGCVFIKIYCKT